MLRLLILLIIGDLALLSVSAQTKVSSSTSASTITAEASTDRVRITAPSSVVQMRIEVYDSNGTKVRSRVLSTTESALF